MGDENVSGEKGFGQLPDAPVNQGGEAQANASGQQVQGNAAVGQSEAEFIRASDAQRMIEEAVERALRQSQSMTDKASARLTQQFNELKGTIEQLKASGSQVPAETLEAMRALSHSLGEPAASNGGNGGQAAGAGGEEEGGADIDAQAAKIYQESGVIVYRNDPEAGMIDHSSPERFLETLTAAAKAKAVREHGGEKPPAERQEDTQGERGQLPMIGRGSQSNPISDVRDPKELYSIALGARRR